jgi:hypothetical protein
VRCCAGLVTRGKGHQSLARAAGVAAVEIAEAEAEGLTGWLRIHCSCGSRARSGVGENNTGSRRVKDETRAKPQQHLTSSGVVLTVL